jgi:TolA-binding protein
VNRGGSGETYEAMRRAFRDLTDVASDGAATRARVLARARQDAERRKRVRHLAAPITAALIVSGTVTAALAVVHRWRAPAPLTIEGIAGRDNGDASSAPHSAAQPVRIIPFEKPPIRDSGGDTAARPPALASFSDAETRAYARAHEAHFADDAPARALDAWDAYLAAFPHGTFAPEATYNRAICLVRLERRAEAARALRRLAAAPPDGYRREEARRLLDWLAAPVTDRSLP